MKQLYVVLVLVALTAGVCSATHYYSTVKKYSATKANLTVPTQEGETLRYITSASTCSVYINTTSGTLGYPVAANTQYEANIAGGTSNLIFACASSAAGSPNTLYVVK